LSSTFPSLVGEPRPGLQDDELATIELRGVTRRFGALTALDDVTFDVADGEIVGLLGHNGAGQTTLTRVINGLLSPDAGAIRVHGLNPVIGGHEVRCITGVLTEYPGTRRVPHDPGEPGNYAAINAIPRPVAALRISQLLLELGLAERRDDRARTIRRPQAAGGAGTARSTTTRGCCSWTSRRPTWIRWPPGLCAR
jgi:ABC-type Na+ transport system ATPase subunit NatA